MTYGNPSDFVLQQDCNSFPIPDLPNTVWSTTDTGTNTVTVAKAAVANTKHVITGLAASTDLDGAVLTIKEDTTEKFELKIGDASAISPICFKFPSPIVLAANKTANCTINGTSNCEANMFGYSITSLG